MNGELLRLLGNHLWQSTLFGAAAGLLTLALRQNRRGFATAFGWRLRGSF